MPTRRDPADDEFLFRQGPARGLGAIRFHDWRGAFDEHAAVPSVAVFREQADGLCALLRDHAPSEDQQRDLDFLLRRPVLDDARTAAVWAQVEAPAGAYEMQP